MIQNTTRYIEVKTIKLEKTMERIYSLFIYIAIVEIASSVVMTWQKSKIENKVRMSKIGKENYETFPYSAIVVLNTRCTGALISCKHILTAAQCVHYSEKTVDVKVSLLSKDGNAKLVDVKKVFIPSGGWKTMMTPRYFIITIMQF